MITGFDAPSSTSVTPGLISYNSTAPGPSTVRVAAPIEAQIIQSVHPAIPRARLIPGYIAVPAGMAVAAMTMKSPLSDRLIATALGGADLSWILGFPVSALSYRLLTATRPRC